MVGMLVGDQDRIEPGWILADRSKPFAGVLETKARIDQQPRALGRDERRVPRAAARKCADPDDNPSPVLLL